MIKHQLEIYKWEFVFLGANQDAIMTGQQLNIPTRSSLTYDSSGKGVESSLSVTSAFLGRFRKSKAPIGFTQEERKKANAN